MKLNINSGNLRFDSITVGQNTSVESLENLCRQINSRIDRIVGGFTFYFLLDVEDGEYSLSIRALNNSVHSISIELGSNYEFPPFEMTKGEKSILESKLQDLGGAREYLWGSVNLSEDSKGGILSILINYIS